MTYCGLPECHEDQEPWRMVAEDASQESPRLSSVLPGHLGARS